MSSPVELTAQPSWLVRTMSLEQIPLVVSWIAAIDPNIEIDQIGVAERMKREMEDAIEIGISEYYIGYFEQLSTFFMVGFLAEGRPTAVPASSAGQNDYEIATLMISPLIAKELHFPLYHQAVQFIFKRDLVGRVIYQVENSNEFLKSILMRLGFWELGFVDSAHTRIWLGCRRADFLEG